MFQKIKKRDGQIRSPIACSEIHRKTTILTSIGVLDQSFGFLTIVSPISVAYFDSADEAKRNCCKQEMT